MAAQSSPEGNGSTHRAQFAAVRAAMHTPGAKRYWVSVMKPDGTIERRPVAIGVMSRVSAQVLAGLKPGDQVVVGMHAAEDQPSRARSSDRANSRYGGRPRMGGIP